LGQQASGAGSSAAASEAWSSKLSVGERLESAGDCFGSAGDLLGPAGGRLGSAGDWLGSADDWLESAGKRGREQRRGVGGVDRL